MDEPRAVHEPSVDLSHGGIRASVSRRFLVHEDGTPFFYLGDTAWELFHRLNRAEVRTYLADRAAKRFTVVQAVLLSELNGLTTPNANGDLPLVDLDPARPDESYFQHVDYVVRQAEEYGLVMALLPTWGSYTVREEHPFLEDHALFNPSNARTYGRFLGARYGNRPNVLWILGGDRVPKGAEETWCAMARGIAEGACGDEDYSSTVMTYHPRGGHSSAEWWHEAPWLTFNMVQSGHQRSSTPHRMIARDYARRPPKPVLNGEPGYEAIPDRLDTNRFKLDARDVRRFAYWSVFAGACGHTYGANEMWMMWTPDIEPIAEQATPLLGADTPWHEALDYPGAGQMRHIRALMESRPFLTRVPDQSLIASEATTGLRHVQASRCADGSYAMVYLPQPGQSVDVRMSRMSAETVTAWWYDPRTGEAHPTAEGLAACGMRGFTAPELGHDWVLVLDAAERRFGLPGGAS